MTGIKCALDKMQVDVAFDRQLSTAIFRIIQKLLANIKAEASATSVRINMKRKRKT